MNFNFDTITASILKEAKNIDPRNYVGVGPAGFRTNTGINNVQKPDKVDSGPADSGLEIQIQNYKLIQFMFQVVLADIKSGMELKKILEYCNQLHFTYVNSKQEVEECEKRKARIESKPKWSPDSDIYQWLVARIKEYSEISAQTKEQIAEETPEIVSKIQWIVKQASTNFAKVIESQQSAKYKSLEDLDKLLGFNRGEDKEQVIEFLKDIFRGGGDFKPLTYLVDTQLEAEKDPLFTLVTAYKTALNTAKNNNLVGNPVAVFNYLTGAGKQIKSIAEPTVGRVAMKKNDPGLAHVVSLIKKKRYADATALLSTTALTPEQQQAVEMGIKSVEAGEMSEADLIRPLYQ